jgi:hypothetical protein
MPYVDDWERNRQAEIEELTAKGIIPNEHEVNKHPEKSIQAVSFLMGDVAMLIKDILPARMIVDNMVNDAAKILQDRNKLVSQWYLHKLASSVKQYLCISYLCYQLNASHFCDERVNSRLMREGTAGDGYSNFERC